MRTNRIWCFVEYTYSIIRESTGSVLLCFRLCYVFSGATFALQSSTQALPDQAAAPSNFVDHHPRESQTSRDAGVLLICDRRFEVVLTYIYIYTYLCLFMLHM